MHCHCYHSTRVPNKGKCLLSIPGPATAPTPITFEHTKSVLFHCFPRCSFIFVLFIQLRFTFALISNNEHINLLQSECRFIIRRHSPFVVRQSACFAFWPSCNVWSGMDCTIQKVGTLHTRLIQLAISYFPFWDWMKDEQMTDTNWLRWSIAKPLCLLLNRRT